MAEGATSRQARRDQTISASSVYSLSKAAKAAASILGAESVELLGLPDNRLDSIDRLDLIKLVEAKIEKHQPDSIYVHHAGDVNIDHRRLHEAVITACRPVPGQTVRQLLSFEVASSTEWQPPGSAPSFAPNWYVDITAQWTRKAKALEAYEEEMREWPHARSIKALEHLARLRGSQVGLEAAEAFCLLRKLR
jgi:LmbE family N-acetylglucosaminyl deacetylase